MATKIANNRFNLLVPQKIVLTFEHPTFQGSSVRLLCSEKKELVVAERSTVEEEQHSPVEDP